MSAHPWVRPYVLTGGRTRGRSQLLVHTLVYGRRYDGGFAARLLPEARALYDRVHTVSESVAELSAHCGISLGVTRVLLSDLAAGDRISIGPETTSPYDPQLLERVIDGLRELA
ncbi:DUF742 domain-containing protein [Actinomadura vinacea]|uniref:DUF742 domain-containing protein n=1 Tax=Actinomadura vinacea TaxID=115336 RepID=A0ABN3JJF1_9ACTN